MNRKQLVGSAFAAAIPAYLLVASMVWALFQGGMLGDDAKVSAALWAVFVLAALGGIIIGVLPFAIVIFPGLYPMAAAAPGPGIVPPGPEGTGSKKAIEQEPVADADVEASGNDDDSEYEDFGDGGDSEFDEFAAEAEEAEEEPQPKKKGRR